MKSPFKTIFFLNSTRSESFLKIHVVFKSAFSLGLLAFDWEIPEGLGMELSKAGLEEGET